MVCKRKITNRLKLTSWNWAGSSSAQTGTCNKKKCYKACLYYPTWWESKRFLELTSKSESEEKEANNTSKKAAKVMTGRMQEDKSQSGSSYSNKQKDKKKNSKMKRKKKRKLLVSPDLTQPGFYQGGATDTDLCLFSHHNFASLLEPFPSQQNFETIEISTKFLSTITLETVSKFWILYPWLQNSSILTNMPTFGTHLPSLIGKGTSIVVLSAFYIAHNSCQYKQFNEEYKNNLFL